MSLTSTEIAEEREMTRNQRNLVDTCFEEGQYESGIAALELLRSTVFKPPPDIIRQLLYIALYPPPSHAEDEQEKPQTPLSPTKGSPSKQKQLLQKTPFVPTIAASAAAQRLLFSFLCTNTPDTLFRGLPMYAVITADDCAPRSEAVSKDYDEDSPIAREALCIKDARHCWATVKEDFIQRGKCAPLPQEKRKRRRKLAIDSADDDSDNACNPVPAVVAEHAWPVLDWFLRVFEKDEILTEKKSRVKFSPLLLSQILLPRGGCGPRQDVDAPLDIMVCCTTQDCSLRRLIGTRLFTLLINLTQTTDFDANMFTAAVIARLYSSPDAVLWLITSLPKTMPILNFQVALCQRYLSGVSQSCGKVRRPKPQARARRDSHATAGSALSAKEGGVSTSTGLAGASCNDMLALLESQDFVELPAITMKYVLLVAYALIQSQTAPDQIDPGWKDVQSNGRLKRAVNNAFPEKGEGLEYRATLLAMCDLWPLS
ncbi:hypothetical protein BKA82DRAFT_995878 [Pisolithus tinctorius]|uniref:Uncharacterized protein n=1 Tax=Pisolithus tinctorius Marx 270 TaxID=870435 RepID=A0A0C3JL93_PISTI|nr:hypothetical protein BKA82DRAFT_995878 [Pisolithus tinctorius]KIO09888.1 hypothetical protein M404DRAFT_995878 [Pisolithus tinctorius Marx 270]